MKERPKNKFVSPDMTKLKEVIIDDRTKIYVPVDADSQEAKEHYLFKLREKNKN